MRITMRCALVISLRCCPEVEELLTPTDVAQDIRVSPLTFDGIVAAIDLDPIFAVGDCKIAKRPASEYSTVLVVLNVGQGDQPK
jgi:hypothetical protein